MKKDRQRDANRQARGRKRQVIRKLKRQSRRQEKTGMRLQKLQARGHENGQ
jgi:hypothetical protein